MSGQINIGSISINQLTTTNSNMLIVAPTILSGMVTMTSGLTVKGAVVFSGTTTIAGNLIVTGSITQNGSVISGGGSSSQWTSSNTNVYFNSGSVGIGTTEPSVKLEVGGNVLIQSGLSVSGNTTITSSLTISGSLNAINTVNVSGITYFNSGVIMNKYLTFSGNTIAGSTNNSISIDSSVDTRLNNYNDLTVYHGINHDFELNSTTFSRISTPLAVGNRNNYNWSVAKDTDGNSYVCGELASGLSVTSAYWSKITSDGTVAWTRSLRHNITMISFATKAVVANNYLYVMGQLYHEQPCSLTVPGGNNNTITITPTQDTVAPSDNQENAFLAKYSLSGDLQYIITFTTNTTNLNIAHDFIVDTSDNVYLECFFKSNTIYVKTFDQNGATNETSYSYTAGGGVQEFIYKFNSSGILQAACNMPDVGQCWALNLYNNTISVLVNAYGGRVFVDSAGTTTTLTAGINIVNLNTSLIYQSNVNIGSATGVNFASFYQDATNYYICYMSLNGGGQPLVILGSNYTYTNSVDRFILFSCTKTPPTLNWIKYVTAPATKLQNMFQDYLYTYFNSFKFNANYSLITVNYNGALSLETTTIDTNVGNIPRGRLFIFDNKTGTAVKNIQLYGVSCGATSVASQIISDYDISDLSNIVYVGGLANVATTTGMTFFERTVTRDTNYNTDAFTIGGNYATRNDTIVIRAPQINLEPFNLYTVSTANIIPSQTLINLVPSTVNIYGNLYVSGTTTFNGGVNMTNLNISSLIVTGNSYITNSGTFLGGLSSSALYVSNNITASGSLVVTGSSTFSNNLTVSSLNITGNGLSTHFPFTDSTNYISGPTVFRGGSCTISSALTVSGTFLSPQSAKAYGNIHLSGTTTISIAQHYNIAAVTYSGLGLYGVAFTSPLKTSNYTVVASVNGDDVDNFFFIEACNSDAQATSTGGFGVRVTKSSSPGGANPHSFTFAVFEN